VSCQQRAILRGAQTVSHARTNASRVYAAVDRRASITCIGSRVEKRRAWIRLAFARFDGLFVELDRVEAARLQPGCDLLARDEEVRAVGAWSEASRARWVACSSLCATSAA